MRGMIQRMEAFIEQNIWVFLLVMLWILSWKGYALWTAARLSHKWWFIVLLILNTLAILDIIYIFFVAKQGERLMRIFRR